MSAPEAIETKRRRRRLKQWLKGLAILLAGMVIGSVLTVQVGHRIMMKALGDPQQMAERLTKRLTRELDLTPEQTEQVHAILTAHGKKVSAIMDQARPAMDEQFEQMHQEVRAVLEPDQQVKWDERFEKMKKWVEKRRPPPH